MLLPLYSDKDNLEKDKNTGLTVTEILKMSQDITADWLKKDAERKVDIKEEQSENKNRK